MKRAREQVVYPRFNFRWKRARNYLIVNLIYTIVVVVVVTVVVVVILFFVGLPATSPASTLISLLLASRCHQPLPRLRSHDPDWHLLHQCPAQRIVDLRAFSSVQHLFPRNRLLCLARVTEKQRLRLLRLNWSHRFRWGRHYWSR